MCCNGSPTAIDFFFFSNTWAVEGREALHCLAILGRRYWALINVSQWLLLCLANRWDQRTALIKISQSRRGRGRKKKKRNPTPKGLTESNHVIPVG